MTVQTVTAHLRRPPDPAAPTRLDSGSCDDLAEQGIGPLLYRALRDTHLLDNQVDEVRDRLVRLAREETLVEPFRRDETTRILRALASEGIHPLVFKGTALAYTCYPEPWLRPRLDTDLLIRPDEIETTSRVFEQLGCTRTLRPSGEHVTHQFTYISVRCQIPIAFDVHWKLADPQAFADLFSYDELAREAVAVPGLSPARTLSDVHALLVACIHRVAHHYDREILIYLYDIDLLARRLSTRAWDRVVAAATTKRIRLVTLRGLDLASNLLGTCIPDHVRAALASSSVPLEQEPTGVYLDAGLRKVDILRADLRELGWRARLKLIREHLLPAPAFVLGSYGQTWAGFLPVLYLIRIIRGATAWFRPLR